MSVTGVDNLVCAAIFSSGACWLAAWQSEPAVCDDVPLNLCSTLANGVADSVEIQPPPLQLRRLLGVAAGLLHKEAPHGVRAQPVVAHLLNGLGDGQFGYRDFVVWRGAR